MSTFISRTKITKQSCTCIGTYGIVSDTGGTYDMTIGKAIETRMRRRCNVSNFDKPIGIYQHILDNVRSTQSLKIHAQQFTLTVRANALLILIRSALLVGKRHNGFIGRFCALAVDVTNTVCVRCTSFGLSRSKNIIHDSVSEL